MAMDSTDKNAVFAGVSILFGFGGLVLVFTDPIEGWPLRITIAIAFFFFSGAVIGYAHPKGWPIAMLTAWGGVLFGGFIILVAYARYGREAFSSVEPPYITTGLIMLFGSLVLTLIGSFLGKSLPRLDARTLPGTR